MRSPLNSALMWVTLLSPALIGGSLTFYDINRLKQDYGWGGFPMPSVVPDWLTDFNNKLLFRSTEWPLLSSLYTHVDSESTAVAFAATSWSVVFLIPVLLWGAYMGWWTDAGMARSGPRLRAVAWAIAVPGFLLGIVVLTAAVVLTVIAVVLIYIAVKSIRGNESQPDTALDGLGRVFKKNSWTGSYEPKQSFFGQEEDTDMFGKPNVERDWQGPKELRGESFGPDPKTPAGEPLFHREAERQQD